ncbi:MAG: phosphoenolpyruvate synthase [Candidatus Nealsonbacteria bacterium RBG_13_38_11]|uniref:Phosphoenolpyruvate synthase n=1 Tax=Candidatus Nealsonbacteria bacterium RBG_13_38_11 TaxID=1801662 RepID=A0A1G2DXZ2_9BACT|nr:MAG: phosphoenolpyruvate synthase [Candidatus Nealsonbacteria bacterium RBG_13_38_11]
MAKQKKYILWFKEISKKDVVLVGGKNASLGEMFSQLNKKGIRVPDGFATTSSAYWYFLEANKLLPKLKKIFKNLDARNIGKLQKAGKEARNLIIRAEFPGDLKEEILKAYRILSQKYKTTNLSIAARSSATAEDLPTASFAGQHETYLNISGEKEVLIAVKKCIVSLFLDRAISYRAEKGFNHFKVALSVGVMKMVRSDVGSAGVIFTLDTETGFRDVVLINGSWGLGEMVVKGRVVPDEFLVHKPTLKKGFSPIISRVLGTKRRKLIYINKGNKTTEEIAVSRRKQDKFVLNDKEVLQLGKWACAIEDHYGFPMDIEWAKDGKTGELFIVQARPETIHASKIGQSYNQYFLKQKGKLLLEGEAIGSKIAFGKAKVIPNIAQIKNFRSGEILVTEMTDPDWTSIMKQAKAIITEQGGRTCHAAIVSRELGIPCIVGADNATRVLKTGRMVTVDCSLGQTGRVFEGQLKFEIRKYNLKKIPKTRTKIMINTSHPDVAFLNSFLPSSGVGLAREEFIIASQIKIHPLALYNFSKLNNADLKRKIDKLTVGYSDKKEYFIDKLSQGIGKIAAGMYPKPVIVRFSDFKSNEYAQLLGGDVFEPEESNPMIGWRGASRYYDQGFLPAFQMECQAIKRVREKFGLKNVKTMVPFCRTVEEGKKVILLMKRFGLERKKDGLEVYVMCEIPSNVILADKFLDVFDGMSIGSNDLTQLVLGLDRDSALISSIGDERDEAVKEMLKTVIAVCKKRKKYCGICGEAPSYFPEFAEFLVSQGIESMSLNPDTVIKTTLIVAKKEKHV